MSSASPNRWERISPYLDEALTMSDEQRAVWMAALQEQDATLAAELQLLLDEHRALAEEEFLERGAIDFPGEAAWAGQKVGAYTLVAPIGQGGMSTVWLGERNDGRFQGRAAIKFLSVALSASAGQARFVREGNILGRFTHPHIARLMDAGVSHAGHPYLVLEYVEGDPIDRYCDRRKLDIEARIRLFRDVLGAVAHAHSHLIVHRDIKPSNVLVSNDGQAKLLDFGIAKLLETDAAGATLLTRPAGGPLTPQYAAPEQLTNGDITTATDVYALGVQLYVLLTGRHPAGGSEQSAAELVQAITSLEPRRMSDVIAARSAEGEQEPAAARSLSKDKLRRALRGDLDTIVAKALKKDPQERYVSAMAFAADLRAHLEHQPISARPDTLAYRATKFVRRNRVQVALALAALAATAAGITGTLMQARTARTERDFAFRQLSRADAINDLQQYVLSDAGPAGKPFTVDDLLARAEHIVRRQRSDPATRVELLLDIGGQYTTNDEYEKSRQLLEEAYRLSKGVPEPAIRAGAACKLGQVVSRMGDPVRANALWREGLADLPDDAFYLLERADCWSRGSEIAMNEDRPNEAVVRAETARQLLAKSPIRSDPDELGSMIVLAGAYNHAGMRGPAISMYQEAAKRLQDLGRDDTEMASTTFNNWGMTLIRAGQPLRAEAVLKRSIDISRDGPGEDSITSTTLGNYALVLYQLGNFQKAANYAERAYTKAIRSGDETAADLALMHRARIYRAEGGLARSQQMLAELEPRLESKFRPGSLPFAVLAMAQAQNAEASGDLGTADKLIKHAVEIMDALAKAGRGSDVYESQMLIERSSIELQLARGAEALSDASRAERLAERAAVPGSSSLDVGHAELALGRALQAQGSVQQAQAAFRSATKNFEAVLGPENPETLQARQLASIAPAR
jgi:serine/threonine protein kinase/Tfp pilus assembly protein PilF